MSPTKCKVSAMALPPKGLTEGLQGGTPKRHERRSVRSTASAVTSSESRGPLCKTPAVPRLGTLLKTFSNVHARASAAERHPMALSTPPSDFQPRRALPYLPYLPRPRRPAGRHPRGPRERRLACATLHLTLTPRVKRPRQDAQVYCENAHMQGHEEAQPHADTTERARR